jgi:hypothetical protein
VSDQASLALTTVREVEGALGKAQREQAKEARNAQNQLETESKAPQKRSRGRESKHKEPQRSSAAVIEPIETIVPVEAKSRIGCTVGDSAHFDEM